MSRPFTFTVLPATGNEYDIVGNPLTPVGVPVVANSTQIIPINSNEPYGWASNSSQMTGAYIFSSIPPLDNGNANVYRTIKVTTSANLTGSSIVVNGIGLTATLTGGANSTTNPDFLNITNPINAPVAETINLGAVPVVSTHYFKKITRITGTFAVGASGTIAVGFGPDGITDPIILDTSRYVYNSSAQVIIQNYSAGQYCVWQTMSDIARPQNMYGNAPYYYNPLDYFHFGLSAYNIAGNTGNLVNNHFTAWDYQVAPMTSALMRFTGITGETLNFTFVQEGID